MDSNPEKPRLEIDLDYFNEVKNIVQLLVTSVSAMKLFPSENPTVREFIDNLSAKLLSFLERHDKLELIIEEFRFICSGQVVYSEELALKSLPFFFYKDGLYALFFYQGLRKEEILEFLELIKKESQKPAEEADMVNALWERDFPNIHYFAPDYYLESRIIEEYQSVAHGEARPFHSVADYFVSENIEINVDTSRLSKGKLELAPEDKKMIEEEPLVYVEEPADSSEIEYYEKKAAKSPAASMDPTLSQSELSKLEEILRANRRISAEEEFTDLMVELINLEDKTENVAATLEAVLDYHFREIESGNFMVVILIIQKMKSLLEHLKKSDQAKAVLVESFLKKIVSSQTIESLRALLIKQKDINWAALLEFFNMLGDASLAMAADLYENIEDQATRDKLLDFIKNQARNDPGIISRLADDSRPELSRQIILLLETYENKRGVPHLASFLNFSNRELKIKAIEALGRVQNETANKILMAFMNDLDESVRIRATFCLSPMTEKSRLKKMIREINSTEFRRRSLEEKQAIMIFLGRTRSEEALGFLKKILFGKTIFFYNFDVETRLAAASGLEALGSQEAINLLEKGAGLRNKTIQKACLQALDRLKEQNSQVNKK